MMNFRDFYMLHEVVDSRRNREAIINQYGLTTHHNLNDTQATQRAKELITLWNKYSPLISPNDDFGLPKHLPGGGPLDPRDIFIWARVAKMQRNPDPYEPLQRLEHMISKLKSKQSKQAEWDEEKNNYTTILSGESPRGSLEWMVVEPHSESASCELGKGTNWCTASRTTNYFVNYTQEQGVRLIYIIAEPKKHNTAQAVWPPKPAIGAGNSSRSPSGGVEKYAIAEYPDGRREYFDDENNAMAHDDFMELVIQRLGIETKDWLKEYSVTDQLHKACARLSQLADQSTSRIELTQAQENIMDIVMELSEANYKDYEKFRAETGMPDKAFIEVSEKHGLTKDTYRFFTIDRFNDPDLKTDYTIKSNKQFRSLFTDTLNERTDLSLRGYGEADHPGGSDDDLWKQVNNTLSFMKHQDQVWELIAYSKNWTDGNWTDLHELTLDAFLELGPIHFTQSEAGMMHGGLLRFCLYELPDNRFKQMEEHAVEQMQIAARQMGLKHPYDLALGNPGENEQMEQWTIKMRKAGWIDFANRYNLFVAGSKGTNDKVSYIPNNPGSYEKLFDYPLPGGEWNSYE